MGVSERVVSLAYLVFRTIGFGTLSVFGRVAAMAGPQLVYLVNYMLPSHLNKNFELMWAIVFFSNTTINEI